MAATREWVARLREEHPEVLRVGYFGSYARDDYVPGSDLDVLIELSASDKDKWVDRVADYRPSGFQVAVDVFPYTSAELDRMRREHAAFLRSILSEIVWLS